MRYTLDQKGIALAKKAAILTGHKIAEQVLDDALVLAPIDTGHLITTGFVDPPAKSMRIGFTAPYARFPELGTRYQHPQRFLTRAALQRRG